MDVCLRLLKESKKSRFDNCSVRNSILIISLITFRDCRVHIFPTTFLEIAANTIDVGAAGNVFPDFFFQTMVIHCLPLFSGLGSKPIGFP